MKQNRILLLPGIMGLLTLILAVLASSIYFSDFEYRYRTRLFNRIVNEKETIMEDCLERMKPLMADEEHIGSFPEKSLFDIAGKNKITILEFLDNKLIAWSDNNFDVPLFYDDSLYNKPLIFLQNGWFIPRTIESGNEKLVGLLRIRTEYSLENDIVESGFEKEYGVQDVAELSVDKNASDFHIVSKSGKFLFSLVFPPAKQATELIIIPIVLWCMFFVILLIITINIIRKLLSISRSTTAVLFALLFSVILYSVILLTGMPAIFSLTELFSPHKFSLNAFVPSLGHLLLLGILCSFFAGVFYRYFPIGETEKKTKFIGNPALILFFITAALLLGFFHLLFSQLILTSNINFMPFRVLDLDIYSVIGFVSAFLLLLLPVLFIFRIIVTLSRQKTSSLYIASLPGVVLLIIMYRSDLISIAGLIPFYLGLITAILVASRRKMTYFNLTIVSSFLFGLYSLYYITKLSDEKITENIKIKAVSYSTENDPEAENLLLDIWPVISKDTILRNLMLQESFNRNSDDVDMISSYLRNTYFGGYWTTFDFNIILCRNDDPLRVGPGEEIFPVCFNFFEERIRRDGHRLTGTEFYFIDNQRGRSFYLGKLMFNSGRYVHGLFIELYGNVNVFQPGYSALLLDKKDHGYTDLKDYSLAKYINGELVLRTGEFPYDKTDDKYVVKSPEYRIFVSGGFRHVLYKNGNATILISRSVTSTGDLVISFAYFFTVLLLLSNIIVIAIRRPVIRQGGIFNFRQKLQLSFVGVLLFSFVLIGIVVSYLTIEQYKTRHNENIKEKLNSVYLELDNRLSAEKHLDRDWRNEGYESLNDLLISLSNIFNTDINLFNINGELIATSRPEIFYRNLTSTRIDYNAFINLTDLKMSEVYQTENIGNLEYTSAYVPFFNSDDRTIAYVNLPYFRVQSVLANEISNFIMAVINFALILILVVIGLAVVISGRLTAPLSMLSEGLASVQLGKKTEHLKYKGNDEIGQLVSQYNQMVDEIAESAGKLANSEREYAWREMAKQIAHEIKNPLTPMKLNVQQLLKSWKDNAAGFNEKLEQFARNQIEYINNLSSIATAFSSFAKLPGAKPSDIDLLDQIKVTLELFRDAEGITFNVEWPAEKKVVVFADKEHLNGIFSNLIKNGIQAIPSERNGAISISVLVVKDWAVISVSDNGSGIPEDIKPKMFIPNFTTKSSGTGLGLSIVKKYVETAGGKIWFESNNQGTTFFIELPLKYTVE
ncbi:MAG TPA: HAMP domain-containing sensor histidine kinase [Bacteroidales bacterium]|nr:HAMP domain-containing sensor histidine kinase [Bacteroidales bacterium]